IEQIVIQSNQIIIQNNQIVILRLHFTSTLPFNTFILTS
ncbi:hypothetical protein Leryth_016261, partial [Lithospermum erythrorhizon]